jgi:hypothetical protein
MSPNNFVFNSKKNNQQKINEYNKKALLQVQNMVANQKRMIENQKRMIENQKNAALNQQPKPQQQKPQQQKPQQQKPQQPKSDILKFNVKVNSFKFV